MLKKKSKYNVAIMGATGAVGTQFLWILEERGFPIDELRLLASERSQGRKLDFKGRGIEVRVLNEESFDGIDIVLASAGATRSKEFLPHAVRAGAVCVDNSSAFRMDKDVPLVVPEVNPHAIERHKGIIANPNCSTIQMVLPLCAINNVAPIRRVVVTTFQSVSGAGQQNILEMESQVTRLAKKDSHYGIGEHTVPPEMISRFAHQIAYNVIPQIDVFLDDLYTKEEMKMVHETRKIMELPGLKLTSTCVRVPVYYAHSESVNIETEKKVSRAEAMSLIGDFPGVKVVDDPEGGKYPMPIDVEGQDEVFVGRIREDGSVENGLNMWVVADNLRKGAALNAIQIAEKLIGL
ncbi:MAG: aspartate-semialdehyde dehydrogenase [Candidatus Omnitrophica bacterium]|nr:aspartate-semialdehyde dehydrogenase [Candidatus Omnitrophota bacterium]MDD5488118.1 aspartate-semialdehyde dehydrogenase [Candidatus Omnitrophota bacterium]